MKDILHITLLYDFYGELLTEHQKNVYEDFVLNDLSLGEIALERGISRQGVRDVIVRAENILTDLEDKTGLIKRFHTMRAQLEVLHRSAVRMAELSVRQDNEELEGLALQIRDTAAALLKE